MTLVRRRWPIYLVVLLIALGTRLVAATWWQSRQPSDQPMAFGDSQGYWTLAERLARGESYQVGDDGQIFRTPGYPAALALLFRANGGEPTRAVVARYWGALWGVATVGATMGLARLLVSEPVALVAGTITAVQPEAIASSVFLLSEATFSLPMVLQLTAWVAAWRAARRGDSTRTLVAWALVSGLAAAGATLMRPSWLLFVPWAAVVLALARIAPSGSWRREATIAACTLVGLAVGMTPWWLRNYHVAGVFVPTTLQVGASLYDGLNPAANGGSDMRFVADFTLLQQIADFIADETPSGLFEERLDRRLRDAALAWARENPGRVVQLAGVKLIRLWNVWPNAQDFRRWPLRLIIAATFLPLVALAGLGAWYGWRQHPALLICFLPAGYVTALHLVFVSSIRYRQPAIFPLAILAAVGVCRWWEGRSP